MSLTWKPQFSFKDVEIKEDLLILTGHFLSVSRMQLRFRLFNGDWSSTVERELLHRRHAAAVLLFDAETDKVVLIEQIRPAVLSIPQESPWVLDVVAGMVDPHETVASAAMREAVEEAGCMVMTLIPISSYWPSVGSSDERITLYCGRIVAPAESSLHGLASEAEDIRIHILDSEQAFRWVQEGVINTSSAIIALQWLQLNRDKLLKEWG